MNLDIFTKTKNWHFTEVDELAEQKFEKLENITRASAPQEFHHMYALTHLEFIKGTQLYKVLKTIPKGVMHHNHFSMNQDQQFYREHIVTDPNIYLAKDKKTFKMGTKQQAAQGQWISFIEARKSYQSQHQFIEEVSNITILNQEELQRLSCKQTEMWQLFQLKIMNFMQIVLTVDVLKKYARHVFLKYMRNGYDRLEFRQNPQKLRQYDMEGNLIKTHGVEKYVQILDEVYNEVKKMYPNFTLGCIYVGFKKLSFEQNFVMLSQLCQLKWDKAIGFDFVQQEDTYGELEEYDPVIDKLLAKYEQFHLKKVYHAGETRNTFSAYVDAAIKLGSVRIGHGLNILQRIDFLPYCQHICFERNPVSNLILGYENDTRESSTPTLLGLGYAVSISPDDPGKFGLQDTTGDYFIAAISYRWTLRHLKLIAYHSINHAVCQDHLKHDLIKSFHHNWNLWVASFLTINQSPSPHKYITPDYFSNTNHWTFTNKQQQAAQKLQYLQASTRKNIPELFYTEKVLNYLQFIKKTELFQRLQTIPKGAFHHDHFDLNEDEQFYREHIINDPIIYLSHDKKSFKIGTKEQAQKQNWISFKEYSKQFQNQDDFVRKVSSLTMIHPQEMERVAGNAEKFWIPFEQKISNFFPILFTRHIFVKYVKHTLIKFIKNGYDRIQFRALLSKLTSYDSEGHIIVEFDESEYMIAFDEAFNEVKKDYPDLTVGFIFFGLKALSDDENERILTKVCELNWDKTVGIDFVQQEDLYGAIDKYDRIADKVLMKFSHLHYKKVYHAGDSKDHYNNNIEIAVKAGSVRIGHGLNILQRVQFLAQCKNICFELNPISNLITGTSNKRDLRMSTAPILLGLGYPVSISSDGPGKFGYEDTTVDYFAASISYNWTLKHLKLIAIHSINHAVCTQGVRKLLHLSFANRWNLWIDNFLEKK